MGFTKLEVISMLKPGYPDEIVPRLPGNFADNCFYFFPYFFSPFMVLMNGFPAIVFKLK